MFSGTVRETHKPEPDESGRIKGLVTYVVDVDMVYKEEGTVVTDTVQVLSQQASASCGLGDLPPGTEYLFFAQARDAGFRRGSCGGSRPATAASVSDVEGVLGPGKQMVPDGAKPELRPHRGRDRRPAAPWARLVAPGVAVALLGLLGLVFVRVAGSRRSSRGTSPTRRVRAGRRRAAASVLALRHGAPCPVELAPGGSYRRICSSWARAAICWA